MGLMSRMGLMCCKHLILAMPTDTFRPKGLRKHHGFNVPASLFALQLRQSDPRIQPGVAYIGQKMNNLVKKGSENHYGSHNSHIG